VGFAGTRRGLLGYSLGRSLDTVVSAFPLGWRVRLVGEQDLKLMTARTDEPHRPASRNILIVAKRLVAEDIAGLRQACYSTWHKGHHPFESVILGIAGRCRQWVPPANRGRYIDHGFRSGAQARREQVQGGAGDAGMASFRFGTLRICLVAEPDG
jgi:hypothetical protein